MKRSSILRSLFLIALCCSWIQNATAAPQLEVVGGPSFDFGDVQPDTTLRHEFVLKNVGDSVLNIEQAKGG